VELVCVMRQPSEPIIDVWVAELICHCQKCQVAGGKTDRGRQIWRTVLETTPNAARRAQKLLSHEAGREPEQHFSSYPLASRQAVPYHRADVKRPCRSWQANEWRFPQPIMAVGHESAALFPRSWEPQPDIGCSDNDARRVGAVAALLDPSSLFRQIEAGC
jgi:hypothetical protein